MGLRFSLFGPKESRFDALDAKLRDAFAKVQEDHANLTQWIGYLNERSARQEELLRQAVARAEQAERASRMAVETNDFRMKSIVASSPAIRALADELRQLDIRVRDIAHATYARQHDRVDVGMVKSEVQHEVALLTRAADERHEQVLERLRALTSRLETVESTLHPKPSVAREPAALLRTTTTNLQERMLRKVQRNSKEYVKNVLQSLLQRYGKLSGLQLREMIVEDQGLCSKSTMYRLLDELVNAGAVRAITTGKDKFFQFVDGGELLSATQ